MSVNVEEEIVNQLRKLTGDTIDDGTLEYMAGMVKEDVLTCTNASAEAVFDLIGPFLEDSGAAADEGAARDICASLVVALEQSGLIKDEGGGGGGEAKVAATALVMNELVKTDDQQGFTDPYLGLKTVSVNYNSGKSLSEAIKENKALQRQREKSLRMMKEWERAQQPVPAPFCRHGDSDLASFNDVIINSFSVSIAGKVLIADSSLKLVIGRKYGLVGRNGIGKSTFLSALARGDISGLSSDIHILHIEQEIMAGTESPLESVMSVDIERSELIKEEAMLEEKEQTEEVGRRMAWVYSRLQTIDASSAEARASTILAGLGFSTDMQNRPTSSFSGGWRMRVALARALFADPDILLLDEPTNHLDLHAVAWLTEYLQKWRKTCIIVSHARQFLNEVCTDIIHFADQALTYYKGDYDNFEEVRAARQKQQQREFDSNQAKAAHMQSFVDRFRYNAKRAALVQSRLKALSKLPLLEAVAKDPALCFHFNPPEPLPSPILVLQEVEFAYKGMEPVLKNVDITVDLESRIAICGVNGSGKSTLLKLLVGHLDPSTGRSFRHAKLRIGIFTQHHVDQLDLTLTPVQQLQVNFPEDDIKDEEARNFFGRFGISGMLALEPQYVLSGGQKSRVAIALVAFKSPHILVLDEPTNHLDLDAVQALVVALNEFEGGVVIVSHDAHMVSCVCDEVWHVDPITKSALKHPGDFDDYRRLVLRGKK